MASKVWNGNTLEQLESYLEQHFEKLEKIETAIRNTEEVTEFQRLRGTTTLDGAGSGSVEFDTPMGYDWLIQALFATDGVGTISAPGFLCVNTPAVSNAIDVVAVNSGNGPGNDHHVPAGAKFFYLVVAQAALANATLQVNVQMKLIKRGSHPPHNSIHNFREGS